MLHLDPDLAEAAPGPEPGDPSDPPAARAPGHRRHAVAPGHHGRHRFEADDRTASRPAGGIPLRSQPWAWGLTALPHHVLTANPTADRDADAHTPAKEG